MKTAFHVLLFLALICIGRAQTDRVYELRSFGAVGDGVALDTKAVQATRDTDGRAAMVLQDAKGIKTGSSPEPTLMP